MKKPKFGTKRALFGYFWDIWNQNLRISVITKFFEETKMPKSGAKNAIFGIFAQEF